MWRRFQEGHDNIIEEVIEQAKAQNLLAEGDVQACLQKLTNKMQPLVANMLLEYNSYKEELSKHLGKNLTCELQRLMVQKVKAMGLESSVTEESEME